MLQTQGRLQLHRLLAVLLLMTAPISQAYNLDPNSTDSIKTISKSLAKNMLSWYNEDDPGLLPQPYYWWEAGAMMGALVDYWYYTKDDSYVDLTTEGLLAQVGEHDDYMPRAQNLNEGNDDQGFWGFAVMSAAEYNFPNPPKDKPQWLALAQAVFNTQAARWDTKHCNGGLRWQIFEWNNGFDYKNSISNACFFALGARLALFTGNSSYAKWAEKTWDWMEGVDLISDQYFVYDGSYISDNCTKLTPYQFSYNAGGMLLGAAAMYNYTESQKWKDRVDGLLDGIKVFFTGPNKDIMTEVACEPVDLCNLDQQSFKAYLSRWMAVTTQWVPDTYDDIMSYLRPSAVAATKQCVGGDNKEMCGLVWNKNKYDGSTGVGQQMAALEVTLSCMIQERNAPVTADNGGTSQGDPGGGGDDLGRTEYEGPDYGPIGAGDIAGAIILTIVVIGTFFAGIVWIFLDETSEKGTLDQFKGFNSSAKESLHAFAYGRPGSTVLVRKQQGEKRYNEKAAGATDSSEQSSQHSSDASAVPPAAPAYMGHARSASEPHQRRMSNMPRGWPHNPSLRGSMLVNPEGPRARPMSMHSVQNSHSNGAYNSASEAGSSERIAEPVLEEPQPLSPGFRHSISEGAR